LQTTKSCNRRRCNADSYVRVCMCAHRDGGAELPFRAQEASPLVSNPSTAAYRLGNHGLGPLGGGGYCLGTS
jgi:hypothetical protein